MEPSVEQATVADDATSASPRLPPMGRSGKYEGRAPRHTTPFEIESNVLRIAIQIAQGRPATYD